MLEYIPSSTDVQKRGRGIARRIYPMRMLGVALLALPFGSVMLQLQLPVLYWIAFAFNVLVWPHLAFWLAYRARDPRKVEFANLVMDTVLGGFWIAAVHLNVMPAAAMLSIFACDRLTAGGWRLLGHVVLAILLAFTLTWVVLGLPFQPYSSMRTMLLALLAMFVYMLALGHVNRSLIHRIASQSQELGRLSRFDPALDLPNRRYFNQRASELLAQARQHGEPASLVVLDVDLFKQVNDRYGHAAGDAVLQRIAALLLEYAGHNGFAARIGGDEFVLLLPLSEVAAGALAARLQQAVAALEMEECAGWRIGVSVGVAGLRAEHIDLDAWLLAADNSLYMAKAVSERHLVSIARH
jgi:diguanylate cyclase